MVFLLPSYRFASTLSTAMRTTTVVRSTRQSGESVIEEGPLNFEIEYRGGDVAYGLPR